MYVYFGFCHAATRCTLQLAATTTETECIKKKNKKPEKQEPTQNHYPFSVSLLFVKKKKNHPESPGKNHVTYPRKAVPVITGYGLSTSLQNTLISTTSGEIFSTIYNTNNQKNKNNQVHLGPITT